LTFFSARRKKLLSLARGKGVVARTRENLYYLTDFYGDGEGVVFPDRTVVVTGALEEERARKVGMEVDVVTAKRWQDARRIVSRHLEGRSVIVDDDEWLTSKRFKKDPKVFLKARKVKDELEVERIGKASRGVDRIYKAMPELLKVGRTEWQVAAEVMRLATEMKLAPPRRDGGFDPMIIASGENGAMGHAQLSDRRLRNGDFVVADIFFRFEGYHTDATRTFAVGTPTAEMKKDYAAVKEAQEAALEVARPGTVCQEMHKAAIAALRRHRLDGYMNHGLGHGVGIGLHESPFLGMGNKTRLERNDVVTDEPGIYRVGKYGIRIEDTLRVDSKPVLLTRYTKDLVACG
jgi:Xaa-Pro aminopeptidase